METSGGGIMEGLHEQFAAFARFGHKEDDGTMITLSNCDKWMRQAKVIDGKRITTTDTSICFKKLFKQAKKIEFEDFRKLVKEVARYRRVEPQEIFEVLVLCGPPGLSATTKAARNNVVDRLTNVSKYTGSQKEKFEGKGRAEALAALKGLDIKKADGDVTRSASKSPSPTPKK